MNNRDEEFQTLAETLIYELTKAFALPQTARTRAMIRFVFGKAARAAAEVGINLDRVVAEGGLSAGARWILPRFVKSHSARGIENIPSRGPLVIAANHPASVDSIVISAYVERPDYKVIIGDIPFFQHLPHINERAFFAPELSDTMGRTQVIRSSIRHLKSGGALLIFPRGGIEPDPEFMPGPDAEFDRWSRSLEIFLQRVPGLQILVTIVSGVIKPAFMRHPITRFRKARPDRQRLAFLHQLARQMLSGRELFGLTPRVTFGEVITGENHEHILADIEQAARRQLHQHMAWGQV
ncbi:MAG: 1-acyl-sn-glycerol-3-phosphate acyltransferase [Anaerolineales bacterium]|nr:1-acyl-sn-glycerol-3-phosphate acyltransferase [Anaerolineales bacterium]NUQ84058.1 1-acyl-sn-glycerol-3-phosphate acyltransferase [Anaerolineales bacterium]